MKTVTVELPDSVELSAAQIQTLVLRGLAQQLPAGPVDLGALLGHPVPPEEAADLRQLIGLYYAERAADLVDAQWQEHGWTPATMHDWVREHLRTTHGRPVA